MSVTSISNRWLNRLYKTIAILLVILAVIISAFRLMLPYAHNYKDALENHLNERFGSHISIEKLTMEWQKLGPILVIENVNLASTDPVDIFIRKIEISVDFWRTIANRVLITSDLKLVGAKVYIDPEAIQLEKVAEDDSGDSLEIDALEKIFLEQTRQFSVIDSRLITKNTALERSFLISRLHWMNEGKRHRAKGDVVVDKLSSNNMKILLDVYGTGRTDMSGQLYLEANNLNITPWLDKVFALDDDKTNSEINFNAWLDIEFGLIENVLVDFGHNEITWQHENEKEKFSFDEGQVLATNLSDFIHFQLNTTELAFSLNDRKLKPLAIQARKDDEGIFAHLSSVDLLGLHGFYPLFSDDKPVIALLEDLALQGHVSDVFLQSKEKQLQVTANFSKINSQYSQGIPGITNVSGNVVIAGEQLQIDLLAENGALDFDKHFMKPIVYQSLSTTVNATVNETGIKLQADKVQLISEEIHLSADVGIDIPNEGLAGMSLLAAVTYGDARVAEHFYPVILMGDDLVEYLDDGIVDGKIEQANVLFNGAFDHFPFEDNSGIFVVDAELIEGRFKFDSDWPEITDFSANLNFTNNSMLITGREGSLTGLSVSGVEAAIEDLAGEQILTVDADINNEDPLDISQLMQLSPMKDTVGETLEQLVVSQPVSGKFNLHLPLNDTDSVIAQGEVHLKNNDVALQTPEMNFTQANGIVKFNNDVITVDELTLNWLGLPLSLSVDAKDHTDYFGTNIHINASWQDSAWLKQVPELLKKYGSGNVDWQGDLALFMHHDGGFSYEATVDSNLASTVLDLPAPYRKASASESPLHAKITGQMNQSTLNATVGKELSFYGVLNHDKVQFSRAHLVLGNEKMLLPMDGFHITTKLENADFSEWQPFILDIIDTVNIISEDYTAQEYALIPQPERIRGTISSLDLFSQTLNNVSFNLRDQQQWWLLHLNAKEARTEVKFFSDWHEQGIEIDADFIHLAMNTEDDVTLSENVNNQDEAPAPVNEEISVTDNDMVFANIPPIKAQCDSCKLGLLDFGELNFEIERDDKAGVISLKNFTASRDKTKLTLEGEWQHNEKTSHTKINGDFSAKKIENEMEKLGYVSTVRDSGLTTVYALDWRGGPHDFSLANLNGDVTNKLDAGYLAEVPDKARVFSLLSMQSLVRKLTFDFRDIFSDGMFYSEINSDLHIKEGILYTDNTKMKGAAGDLTIKGNTDLVDQKLDYRMSYKPNYGASIPAIAWIATLNPAIALAGFALDEVFISKVVSEFTFELTGTVDNPNLKEVDRKSQDISVGKSTPPTIVEHSESDDKNIPINDNDKT